MSSPDMISFADDAEWRYRLHLLALRGGSSEIQPGYRRTEERLRPRIPKLPVDWTSVAQALAADQAPDGDRAWFDTRDAAESGERQRIVAVFDADPQVACWRARPEALALHPRLVISSAIRSVPALAPSVAVVALGHDTPACLAWLASVSLESYGAVQAALPGLALETARFAALMLGAQQHALGLPDQALDTLLNAIVAVVVPPQHRGAETAALLQDCRAAGLLPEHPGEFERMIHGISRRRADRVHRAWLRGSFALPAPPVAAS